MIGVDEIKLTLKLCNNTEVNCCKVFEDLVLALAAILGAVVQHANLNSL